MELAEQKQRSDHEVIRDIHERVKTIAANIERTQISDYVHLMNRPWKIITTNLLAGIARGVGIAIGFTVFASTILYFLQMLGALNLPIIGNYIAEIVKIVQSQLEVRTY